MDKPDVDFIEGLSPAISIDQKSASPQPALDRGDHHRGLRLPAAPVRPHRPPALPDLRAARWPARPPSRSSTGCSSCPRGPASRSWRRWCGGARASTAPCSTTWPSRASPGCGSTASRSSWPTGPTSALARYETHTIEVVVDRLVRRANIRQRLTESIETALALTGGTAEVLVMDAADGGRGRRGASRSPSTWPARTAASASRSRRRATSPSTRPTAPARSASASGTRFEVDPELVVPDDSLSLAEGALAPWAGARSEYFTGLQAGVAELGGFSFDAPWKSLKAKDKKLVLYGTGSRSRCTSPTRTASTGRAPTRRSSRASSRGCSDATASPSRTGRASRSSSTCARSTAPPATGPG